MPGVAVHWSPVPPASQRRVPIRRHSPWPTTQTWPLFGQSSSVKPSQSLSLPSHVSDVGVPGWASHSIPEPSALQTCTPWRKHSPIPTVHAVPLAAQSSSIWPSQSLSLPSHRSLAAWPGTASHCRPDPSALQTCTPNRRHSPTPARQGLPLSAKSSSTAPSQSLSFPSQISFVAGAGTASHTTPPPRSSHTITPARRHSPTPAKHTAPRSGNGSSVSPLQSSSTPLHTSGPGVSAVHPSHPAPGSHVSTPRHVPCSFCTRHSRVLPVSPARQSHQPDAGRHCFRPPPASAQTYPAGHTPPPGPVFGCSDPAPQSHAQYFFPSPDTSTHRSPGTWHAASVAHGTHSVSGNGTHARSDACQYPSSHTSTTHRGCAPVASHFATPCSTIPSHDTPHAPQWSKAAYFPVPGSL